jgi:alanine racemase
VTLRLTVDSAAWRRHIGDVVAQVGALAPTVTLVPVVKGNGYGFGRGTLATIAADLADVVAVGTVHELHDLPAGPTPVVLTPTLTPPLPAPHRPTPILTVGSPAHIEALTGWGGPVLVKLVSSMQRYGGSHDLADDARAAGLEVIGYSVHPPLAGSDDDHLAEVERWLPHLEPDLPIWVSHLTVEAARQLPTNHRYRLRLGTSLWHGDKTMLGLSADVIDVRRVSRGDRAGYRLTHVDGDGWLVMVGAGTAHGVHPLPDGRSPFHFARRRLPLLEPPHMHTSMVFVADSAMPAAIGDEVDVQRPLTTTWVDTVDWA